MLLDDYQLLYVMLCMQFMLNPFIQIIQHPNSNQHGGNDNIAEYIISL